MGYSSSTQAANPGVVVINEIAWMGSAPEEGETTRQAANDEWIELYNASGEIISLEGWVLASVDGRPSVTLSGTVEPDDYFLLSRANETINSVAADFVYPYKNNALSNSGEYLQLFDSNNNLIDEINASSGWPAGDNSTKQTMEHKNPKLSGSDPDSFGTSINVGGTPGTQNSIYEPKIPSSIESEPSPISSEEPEQEPVPNPTPTPPTTGEPTGEPRSIEPEPISQSEPQDTLVQNVPSPAFATTNGTSDETQDNSIHSSQNTSTSSLQGPKSLSAAQGNQPPPQATTTYLEPEPKVVYPKTIPIEKLESPSRAPEESQIASPSSPMADTNQVKSNTTDQKNIEEASGVNSKEIPTQLASIGEATPRTNSNVTLYVLASLLALFSAMFIFILKKRLHS